MITKAIKEKHIAGLKLIKSIIENCMYSEIDNNNEIPDEIINNLAELHGNLSRFITD